MAPEPVKVIVYRAGTAYLSAGKEAEQHVIREPAGIAPAEKHACAGPLGCKGFFYY
jgi:hypothetical protein